MLWISGQPDGHRQGQAKAPDGATIPYREWFRPDARGVILYLHGQGDHSGPFTAMGDRLHEQGFNVYAHDHRGFGLSEEPRGHIASYDLFVDDVMTMLRHAQGRNHRCPVFLLGLSMGGHLALRSAYRAGDSVAGVVALSPGFKLRKPPPVSLVLRTLWHATFNSRQHLPIPFSLAVTTRNRTHLERARQDEYWVRSYTGRFFLETVRSIYRARREVAQLRVPVLMLQAAEDYVVCPQESQRIFRQIGCRDKEYRLLEGLCHNLVAEPEMPQLASEIGAWIEKRISGGRVEMAIN